jgi:hypothetical protein
MVQGGQGDVALPASPGPAFEVVQAGCLQLTVIVLDPPTDLGQPDEFGGRRPGGQVGQPVIGGLIGVRGPLGQQPALRQAAIIRSGDIAVGVADPYGEEVTGHERVRVAAGGLGALPPGHPLDLVCVGDREPAQVHRLGRVGGLGRPSGAAPQGVRVTGSASPAYALVVPLTASTNRQQWAASSSWKVVLSSWRHRRSLPPVRPRRR